MPRAALFLTALVVAIVVSGCATCLRGPINASPGFRWWLFSNFGASKICPEMLKRGVALRTQDRAPAVGRFFPNQCTVDVDDAQKLVTVHFSGTGYAYTPVTKRVGFSANASVQYKSDFWVGEEDIYVWGKVHRILHGPSFKLGYVENPLADAATAMTPLGTVANTFGNQIVAGELTRGFTAVHNEDKGNDFTLGILTPPNKPHHPFDAQDNAYFTFANETIEVNSNQRDYLGPFEVVDEDQRLFVKFLLQGPAVDVMVVAKPVGDSWRDAYQRGMELTQLPGPVVAGGPLQPGREFRAVYRLPKGIYYVVIDNTAKAGSVAPPISTPMIPFVGAAARINYIAQLGEVD